MSEKINGLISAIVQDFYTGQVLMLAHVNQEAYDAMLKTGETHFFSRSRNKLWRKGEESGNIQKIHNIRFDCDRDTILIQVEQTGTGACHTGSYSCFGEDNADYLVTKKVFDQITDRAKNPVAKSYTNYLLDAGVDKICKKLGEETTEAVIAAKNQNRTELIGELCDLTYHALVLMHTQSITPADINAENAKRHGITGNLKAKNQKGEL
jgi:phosphoribosyl-ATP pyrophosphohydrolase/phosphoribosyl-AMP cyclohydrolase